MGVCGRKREKGCKVPNPMCAECPKCADSPKKSKNRLSVKFKEPKKYVAKSVKEMRRGVLSRLKSAKAAARERMERAMSGEESPVKPKKKKKSKDLLMDDFYDWGDEGFGSGKALAQASEQIKKTKWSKVTDAQRAMMQEELQTFLVSEKGKKKLVDKAPAALPVAAPAPIAPSVLSHQFAAGAGASDAPVAMLVARKKPKPAAS